MKFVFYFELRYDCTNGHKEKCGKNKHNPIYHSIFITHKPTEKYNNNNIKKCLKFGVVCVGGGG